jgi:hypothetical protein
MPLSMLVKLRFDLIALILRRGQRGETAVPGADEWDWYFL